ncbi:MAG: metallophosphoesterase [Gemmatimonadetes bacterium]|nr:metallophosphoesterase [Gemmatimonadota bacterium]
MRLVHLSDLHLGIRQFQRQTPAGMNQREADVAGVFARVVDKVIALAPDIVAIAGDVFHSVRPPNPAILHAFHQLSRLRHALPETVVVIVAGNHDSPRAVETGCILRLFIPLGVHVVDTEPKRLAFPERGLSILAIPDVPGHKPSFDIDPAARYNVLVGHLNMPGAFPDVGYEEPAAVNIAPEDIRYEDWSYCAFGHRHSFFQLAPNAYYSGAMEYTGSNIWGEKREEDKSIKGKCLIEFDLDTRKRTIHKIEPSRELFDLPPIDARGRTASEIDAQIRQHVGKVRGGIEGKIVRQVVNNIAAHVARDLDHKQLRELRHAALQYQLDTRRPESLRSLPLSGGGSRRPSLQELVRDRLRAIPLEPDIDREALVDLGLRYLAEAEAREGSPGAPPVEIDG